MSLNVTTTQLVDQISQKSEELRIVVHDDGLNVPVYDFGVKVPGSLGAGIELARVCTANLATIDVLPSNPAIWTGPAVTIRTNHPIAACMASQYAGWKVSYEDYFAMGSGPMRAAAGDEEIFEQIGLRESPLVAVGVLESSKLPPPEVCRRIADDCDVESRKLSLLVAPTSSLAGTIQIVARSLETALHKLFELEFDLTQVVSGMGVAPMPPVAADDLIGIGRTNDAILYGGQVNLWVESEDSLLEELMPKVPSNASAMHGKPFAQIFAEAGHDFYEIDPLLFSPAWIQINNLRSGRIFTAGQLAPQVIAESFGVE